MKLTKNQAKNWIPILQAFVDGKPLEFLNHYEVKEDGKINPVYTDIDTSEVLPMTALNHMDYQPDFYRIK